jgi:hypothetical protein
MRFVLSEIFKIKGVTQILDLYVYNTLPIIKADFEVHFYLLA